MSQSIYAAPAPAHTFSQASRRAGCSRSPASDPWIRPRTTRRRPEDRPDGALPCRTTLFVDLPHEAMLVEIDALALA